MDANKVESPPDTTQAQGEPKQIAPAAQTTTEAPSREEALAAVAEQVSSGEMFGDKDPEPPPAPEQHAPPTGTPAPAPKAEPEAEDPEAIYDDADDPRADEIDPKFTRIRDNFGKMKQKLRAARKGELEAKRLKELAKLGNLDDVALEAWVELGARGNLGDAEAIQELGARLAAAGYQFTAPTPKTPEPQIEDVDTLTERIFKSEFKAEVEGMEMSEAAAKKAARKLAEQTLAAKKATALSQPPQQTVQRPAPPVPQARQQGVDPIQERANTEINRMNAAYASSYGAAWKEIEAEAVKAVQAEIAKGVRLHPIRWTADWQEKVRQAALRRARTAAPAPVKPQESLRPSRGTPASSAAPSTMEERRAQIAAAMRAGKLDDLP